MKRKYIIYILLGLLMLLFFSQSLFSQGVAKFIRIGSLWAKVVDSGDEGEGSWGWGMSPSYFDGFGWAGMFSSKAMFLGCTNFTDTTGTLNPIKVSGHGQWEIDDLRIWMPVPDAQGYTIHRYMRYQPPAIVVDGMHTEDPYPFDFSDHVDPAKIPGTADIMLESYINTDMGVQIHQKVYAFSHKDYDDFQIFEWTFKNTGNADLDDDIELNQPLENVYFLRQIRYFEDPKPWASSYGWFPGDSMRILYSYPCRWEDAEFDMFGNVQVESGMIQHPYFMGEVILFASESPQNPLTDDENQPVTTGPGDCDLESVTWHSNTLSPTQRDNLYALMSEGFSAYPGYGEDDMEGTKPGNHAVPFDEREFMFPTETPWFGYTLAGFYACGPYTLAIGDSFKVVWAQVQGMISPSKAAEIGVAWLEGTCQWDGPDILPPPYQLYPELYEEDEYSTEENNWAKDNWVFTGKDSLFRNASSAQKAWRNNLNIPAAPYPPSLEVTSLPDRIRIRWWPTEEGYDSGVTGYKVYRARGSYFVHVPEYETEIIGGGWELIGETGAGGQQFDDFTAQRGVAYYYYVTAVNSAGVESGKFLNMTTTPAHLLKKAAETLDSVRVVPNPFNLAASSIQWPGEQNKILFVNLPMECTIRIYTESGDLVKVIEHFGSGDESWGILAEEHMVSDSGQIVVSGVYIAYIETPDGRSTVVKFVIVR